MRAVLQQKLEKTEIVIYKSRIIKARDFLNKLEHKKEDPLTSAKRKFRILESLKKH